MTRMGRRVQRKEFRVQREGERRADIPVRHFNSYHKRQTRRQGKAGKINHRGHREHRGEREGKECRVQSAEFRVQSAERGERHKGAKAEWELDP